MRQKARRAALSVRALCPRSLAAASAGLRRSSSAATLDLIPSSLAPASPCSPFSVRSTPAAALAPPARASVPPHTHTKPPAHPPDRPPPLTTRHGPPNSVITVCYRSQPGVLEMYVVKRSGKKEPVHFDKITARIAKLCYGLDQVKVQPVLVAQKVCYYRPASFRPPPLAALTTTRCLRRSAPGCTRT